MLKLSDNPPALYPENSNLEEITGPWWVAHTKSRNEKALAKQLQRSEIAYFLPLTEKVTRRKGRKYKSLLPLFSGYLFFCGDEDDRYRAMTGNHIAQVIHVSDQAKLVRELGQIYRALQSGLPVDTHRDIQRGAWCRVTDGPLMGLEGRVVRRKGVTRILLKVEMLGQAAAVEIDADLLEAVE